MEDEALKSEELRLRRGTRRRIGAAAAGRLRSLISVFSISLLAKDPLSSLLSHLFYSHLLPLHNALNRSIL